MRRCFFLLLVSLILLINSLGCGSQQVMYDKSGNRVYSLSQVQEDYKQFENLIKTNHPIKYGDRDEVYKAFETQYKLLKDNMTEQEFLKVLAPVISRISCGHTYLNFSDSFQEQVKDKACYLPLLIRVVDGGLFLYYDGSNSSIPPGAMISTINGRDYKDIINTIKNSISSDGPNTSFKYYEMNTSFNELYFKYVDASDKFDIRYLNVNNNMAEPVYVTVKAIDKAQLDAIKNSISPSRDTDTASKFVTGEDYAVLTVKFFNYYDDKDKAKFKDDIGNFFSALKQMNIGNLILDLRGNMEGDPYCSSYLYTYLIDKPLPYFSPDTLEYDDLKKPLSPASNSFSGKLYILIDGGCFSSTGHLCSLLKYNNRGIFIGEETGGSFACTDGSKTVYLKNTGVSIHYSTKEYKTAVSGMTPSRGIMPDFPVKYRMEDYLTHKDLEMELAVEMIKKSTPVTQDKPEILSSDLKAVENETFAYVSKNGYLKLRSIKDASEQTVALETPVADYDFNLKDGKVVYTVGKPEDIIVSTEYLYDFVTKSKEILNDGIDSKITRWSPTGKYIAFVFGTGPGSGIVKLYDTQNRLWLKVPDMGELSPNFFSWAPSKDILGLIMKSMPNPPSPVGEGETQSAAVYFPDGNGQSRILAEGTSTYGYSITGWKDDRTVIIKKTQYDELGNAAYFDGDIQSGSIKEGQNPENAIKVPDEVIKYGYSISPDNKYILYTFYDEEYEEMKIALWDTDKQSKTIICPGSIPRSIKYN